MKRFLLIAATALFVVSAQAQVASKRPVAKATSPQKVTAPAQFKKSMIAPAKDAGQTVVAGNVKKSKKFSASASMRKSFMPVNNHKALVKGGSRAAEVQASYNATGQDQTNEGPVSVQWTMKSGTLDDGKLALQDVIPNCFDFEDGVVVEYTLTGNEVSIQPQLVASMEEEGYYIYLMNFNTDDGIIKLTLGEDGSLTSNDKINIAYGVFSAQQYDETFETYLGYYEYVRYIKYNIPGAAPLAPEVSFMPGNTMLFAGLGVSGYSYNANLAMFGAYAPMNFANRTTDFASVWNWSAIEGEECWIRFI